MKRNRKIYKVPVIGYLLHLLEAFLRMPRNDIRLAKAREDIQNLQQQHEFSGPGPAGDCSSLAGLVPQFLNSISSVSAFAHKLRATEDSLQSVRATTEDSLQSVRATQANQNDQVARLWERIEFVRREIMYEMSHGGKANGTTQVEIPTRIVSQDKVGIAVKTGNLRLNLGCGHIALDDYINVDMRELPNVDIVAGVDSIPLEPGTVDEIHSAHLVEHFPQEGLRRRLLPHWHSLLKPGGMLRAITPDATAMIAASAEGTYGFEDFREVLFGAQDYDGDYHYNLLSPESMTELLEEAGFTDIQVPVAGRRNGRCYEFEITAIRKEG